LGRIPTVSYGDLVKHHFGPSERLIVRNVDQLIARYNRINSCSGIFDFIFNVREAKFLGGLLYIRIILLKQVFLITKLEYLISVGLKNDYGALIIRYFDLFLKRRKQGAHLQAQSFFAVF